VAAAAAAAGRRERRKEVNSFEIKYIRRLLNRLLSAVTVKETPDKMLRRLIAARRGNSRDVSRELFHLLCGEKSDERPDREIPRM